jgi:hypothetical protein
MSDELKEAKAWIDAGGPTVDKAPQQPGVAGSVDGSDGGSADSEGGGEEAEGLPSPRQVARARRPRPVESKVTKADSVEHVLATGPWASTPAVRRGGKIFVNVSARCL